MVGRQHFLDATVRTIQFNDGAVMPATPDAPDLSSNRTVALK
jgi:hypothetical protein